MSRKSSAENNARRAVYSMRRSIGKNIRKYRLALGWSQQELADEFGVSRATISHCEVGSGEIDAGDLPRLAEILGINLLQFYESASDAHFLETGVTTTYSHIVAAEYIEKHGGLNGKQQSTHQTGMDGEAKLGYLARGPVIGIGSTPDLFVLDDYHGEMFDIPTDKDTIPSTETVAHLVKLGKYLVSLPLQDQDTLLRVAEALHHSPATLSETRPVSPSKESE